ncbi:MAG: adenosylmethionine decarboxylase [bacterium]|nr:adenosylmethionine decarboxylase [bacterium]
MHDEEPTFFEGTEKKVELLLDPGQGSLRVRGHDGWASICERSGARILSTLSNDQCDAYLLSESSLFVFDHKLLMITCGRTRLVDAALHMLDVVPPEAVRYLAYERKNEVFPHCQETSFFDDVRLLSERLPGRAFKFGHEDDHHLYLFEADAGAGGDLDDPTVEILMYGLHSDASRLFDKSRGGTIEGVRSTTGMPELIPGYEIDDHLFEPRGYSVNAIARDRYWTVHVTPNEISSYASFETNHSVGTDLEAICDRVLGLFRPRAFDLVMFDQPSELAFEVEGYVMKSRFEQDVESGFRVRFVSYYRPQTGIERPAELPWGTPS